MKINHSDKEMLNYYNKLPPKIKNQLNASSAEVSTLGELMLMAEHYNQQEEIPSEFKF